MTKNKQLSRKYKWIIRLGMAFVIQLFGITILQADNLNMKDANIRVLIEAVSRITGKTFVLDPRINNQKITILSPANVDLNKEEIYSIFLAALKMNQLAAIEDGVLIKITQDQLAKSEPVPVESDSGGNNRGDTLITRVIKVINVDAKQLTPVLRPLIRQTGHMAVYAESNVIVIHDRASNIERLVKIIRQVDKASDVSMEIIPLHNANAVEVVKILERLEKRTATKGATRSVPNIVADERTNSILISGETNSRLRLRTIIAQLDSQVESNGNTKVFYLRYAKAEDIKSVLVGQAKIVAAEGGSAANVKTSAPSSRRNSMDYNIESHEATNSLIISAPPNMMNTFEAVIRQLDIRLAQVLVEAIIVEVSDNKAKELGVQWLFTGNGSNAPAGGTNFTNTGPGIISIAGAAAANRGTQNGSTTVVNPDTGVSTTTTNSSNGDNGVALGEVLSGVRGLAIGVADEGLDWAMFIRALGTDTDSNILSTPSIMALDNKPASIHVGQEVPIITGSTTGSNNANPFQSVERQEVGIKLEITPQINEGDAVILEMSQEVSSVAGATSTDIIINKRSINTSVLVESGNTIVIGGLIDDGIQESSQKVPLLGDLPLIGTLFRSQATTKSKRNLMVFIRPTIVRDEASIANLTSRKYNYIRARQLERKAEGINLMSDDESMPVLPTFDESLTLPPSFEETVKDKENQN
ncbi:MAG: type II secretion system secretin GspD [Gammaproteobacteria bacterium]|nr:type II secretion system secretin GspD [Gammaproteobacteria bacterium]